MILVDGAKVWLVVFLVLGAIVGLANIAAQVGRHSLQRVEASVRVQAAYASLDNAVQTYESDTKGCGTSLSCLTTPARNVAPAFGSFASNVEGIPEPADADADASKLVAVATHTEAVFSELGAATSAAAYQETLQSNGPILSQFSQAYQALVDQLR